MTQYAISNLLGYRFDASKLLFRQLKKIHFLPLSESCPNYLFKVSTDEFIPIGYQKRLTSISLNPEDGSVSYNASFGSLSKELQMYSQKVKIAVQSTCLKMYVEASQVGQWSGSSPITCLDAISCNR